MEITVLGAGYVGLVTASWLAAEGHHVRILDPDVRKILAIQRGRAPFFEAGLDEAVSRSSHAGLLLATSDPSEALASADLALICTGTPLTADGESDVTQVAQACGTVADFHEALPVVVRSTLPLGASELLMSWLRRSDWSGIATNPEFMRQGSAVADMRTPDRIILGTIDGRHNRASELALNLHEGIDTPRVVTDFTTAELIKNVANAFLAARLSLVNEVADLCEAYGADVQAVTHAVGMDPRIGASYLRAGIGFGGSCLPKELANLVRLAERKGLNVRALEGAGRSNDVRPSRISDRLEREIGSMRNRTVALLGLAFKAGTDDLRNSPSVALARALLAKGAIVIAHDPKVPMAATDGVNGMRRAPTPEEAIAGAHMTVIATEWSVYAELDWAALARTAASPVVFDGRRILDRERVAAAGWRLIRVGEPSSQHNERGA